MSGKRRSAVWRRISWRNKQIEPQYLIDNQQRHLPRGCKIGFMAVTSATNTRTMIASLLHDMPCAHPVPVLQIDGCSDEKRAVLCAILNSFAYDFSLRVRLTGLHAGWFVVKETPILSSTAGASCRQAIASLAMSLTGLRGLRLSSSLAHSSVTYSERLRSRILIDVLVSALFGLGETDVRHILRDCYTPRLRDRRDIALRTNPRGAWRVDKNMDVELRQTVLTAVAFSDLESRIRDCGGDRGRGIAEFLAQNHGEGWLLPETLHLADYDLGHDERAKRPQPVASRLGPRYYDWQLAQSPAEASAECRVHARNLFGPEDRL